MNSQEVFEVEATNIIAGTEATHRDQARPCKDPLPVQYSSHAAAIQTSTFSSVPKGDPTMTLEMPKRKKQGRRFG
jgi:hypothetical protein